MQIFKVYAMRKWSYFIRVEDGEVAEAVAANFADESYDDLLIETDVDAYPRDIYDKELDNETIYNSEEDTEELREILQETTVIQPNPDQGNLF